MTVTIYNAISLDGYISGPNQKENWLASADEKHFENICADADLVIMGSKTYDSNRELYPVPGKQNVVFTQRPEERTAIEGITFTSEEPIGFIRKHEGKNILAAGGGKLNATLLKAKIVTDISVAVHPIILGGGTRQFEGIDHTAETNLTKVAEEDLGEGVVLIHYTVV